MREGLQASGAAKNNRIRRNRIYNITFIHLYVLLFIHSHLVQKNSNLNVSTIIIVNTFKQIKFQSCLSQVNTF